ncbi:hypothetical protein EV424DRAFT_1349662 [Suillus variegatus]|nr:hypothetical protein EV424DRAFT_1349662 [Suillus variegatus]
MAITTITTESRIPRYQLHDTCAHKATTKKTTKTTNIEAGPLRTNSALRETPAHLQSETVETKREKLGGKTLVDTTSVSRNNEETEKNTHLETPVNERSRSPERPTDTGNGQSGEWTTIEQRRAAGARGVTQKKGEHQNLTWEQENLVRKAENKLTLAERERVRTRWNIPSRPSSDSSESEESPVAGPSKDKGKIPDPRNWGDVDLDDEDIDLEAQRATLASYWAAQGEEPDVQVQEEVLHTYKAAQEWAQSSEEGRAQRKVPGDDLITRAEAEAAVRAAERVIEKQYKEYLRERQKEERDIPGSEIKIPLRDAQGDGPSATGGTQKLHRTGIRSLGQATQQKQKTHPELRRQAFHQFLMEGTAYVKDGKVERKRRVYILAHHLKGRACEFYIREVSGNPYR